MEFDITFSKNKFTKKPTSFKEVTHRLDKKNAKTFCGLKDNKKLQVTVKSIFVDCSKCRKEIDKLFKGGLKL